jgi:hypothetical protein
MLFIEHACQQLNGGRVRQVLFKYADGAFGLYPKTLTGNAPLTFYLGVRVGRHGFWLYEAQYGADRWIDTITWQRFGA